MKTAKCQVVKKARHQLSVNFFDQSIIKFDEKMSQARDRLKKKTFSISPKPFSILYYSFTLSYAINKALRLLLDFSHMPRHIRNFFSDILGPFSTLGGCYKSFLRVTMEQHALNSSNLSPQRAALKS
jgi:hypothetical protein